jgi:hypothetical protein
MKFRKILPGIPVSGQFPPALGTVRQVTLGAPTGQSAQVPARVQCQSCLIGVFHILYRFLFSM